ncbi:hypothetical protein CORT_0C02470 [Candida orthopsilosis Co 90-125]|uniref:Uncharacterized protein n=1 Tax=Candida orthopsilosis (strain 90-125) TaxID=1136231 RepID=H8X2S5_CANO9|nr:hypothetical protein CORT_0C02470 [Candida orthopsilosis Co 90-125]CCG25622.1 hypothetical protein CORT_0C02470 [Candida orthopsilosis Co 90-125]
MIDFVSKQTTYDTCLEGNFYNGKHFAARVSAVPVLFVLSVVGSFSPLLAAYSKKFMVPEWIFNGIRYFGSGVIIATGFIHLMAEAAAALSNTCLGPPFTDYPFAEGIALIAVFFIFFFDIVAHYKLSNKAKARIDNEKHCAFPIGFESVTGEPSTNICRACEPIEEEQESDASRKSSDIEINERNLSKLESLYQQILNCVVLECGIVLHSIFVGLSLAIAGDEFVTLYIAIGFHQLFEGLGLGTRFATTQWPKGKRYVPWLMSLAYSLTTPFACGIGLIVRETYPAGSRTSLITTGTFDATCAGILIYNSIAELMAFDFMYSGDFKDKPVKNLLFAYFYLSLGAFAMAFIGKWA